MGCLQAKNALLLFPLKRRSVCQTPGNVQRIPRASFGADVELEEGLVVSFSDAANSELPGVVRQFDDDMVEVDFNHPLAGRNLSFEVRILDVQPS